MRAKPSSISLAQLPAVERKGKPMKAKPKVTLTPGPPEGRDDSKTARGGSQDRDYTQAT